MKRATSIGCLGSGWVVLALVAFTSGASAQSLTISGPTTANVGDQIVLDIVADATGGTPDFLTYARVRWDPALAVAVSMVPTPESTTFIPGGPGIGPGQANAVNFINNPFTTAALPGEVLGGQLTLDLIEAGTLELSFDAPFPLDDPRFFGLAPGQAGTWQVVVPEPTKGLLFSTGALAIAVLARRRSIAASRHLR